MSNESFNWKSLFIKEDENSTENTTKKETEPSKPISLPKDVKFPENNTLPNKLPVANAGLTNPFLGEILDVYQKGFDSLNLDHFDFFELYKSVQAVGVSNPQSYQMAFMVGKSIKPDLTKEFLIEKAKYYITEIEKVHKDFENRGKDKRRDLIEAQSKENTQLSKRISELENEIEKLKIELENKKIELNKLDANYANPIQETQLKIEANNMAKTTILDSINSVMNGINQYL
jgi:uncharacterized small protein (DUF1192 family)